MGADFPSCGAQVAEDTPLFAAVLYVTLPPDPVLKNTYPLAYVKTQTYPGDKVVFNCLRLVQKYFFAVLEAFP